MAVSATGTRVQYLVHRMELIIMNNNNNHLNNTLKFCSLLTDLKARQIEQSEFDLIDQEISPLNNIMQIKFSSRITLRGVCLIYYHDQSEASISVVWSVLTNQRTVLCTSTVQGRPEVDHRDLSIPVNSWDAREQFLIWQPCKQKDDHHYEHNI